MTGPIQIARRLRTDVSGVFMVEFALALPAFLFFALGMAELSHYAIASDRVSQIAMTAADNAARVRSSIDEIDVNEVMTGAKFVGKNINFAANGRVIISSLEPNAAGNGQWIRWQRCAGAKAASSTFGVQGDGQNDSSLQGMGPSGKKITALTGTALIFAEVTYDYQPLVPMPSLGWGNRTMSFTFATNVRERTDQALKNSKNLTGANISACNLYSA